MVIALSMSVNLLFETFALDVAPCLWLPMLLLVDWIFPMSFT